MLQKKDESSIAASYSVCLCNSFDRFRSISPVYTTFLSFSLTSSQSFSFLSSCSCGAVRKRANGTRPPSACPYHIQTSIHTLMAEIPSFGGSASSDCAELISHRALAPKKGWEQNEKNVTLLVPAPAFFFPAENTVGLCEDT